MNSSARMRISKASSVLLCAAAFAITGLATGCSNGGPAASTLPTTATTAPATTFTSSGGEPADTTSTTAATTAAGLPDGTGGAPRVVTFVTDDGITLSGHLLGSGKWGVVLSHMYPADQTSWYPVAERLAQEGYLVLTFDFRGYGESQGTQDIKSIDKDVAAAFLCTRDAGASDIVLVGASMGGTASLMAARDLMTLSSVRLAGVVTLSAPVEFMGLSAREAVPALLGLPLLFMAAEDDVGAEGARELEELSGDEGDLMIVPGSEHGTDLFAGAETDTVWELLLGFLEQNLDLGNL